MPAIAETTDAALPTGAPLRWRSWPARESPLKAGGAVLALAAIAVIAQRTTGQAALGWLAAVLLGAGLWRFFLPVDLELSAGGVDQWFLGRRHHIAWKAVRRCAVLRGGVLLLPEENYCPMDVFRSVYIPWGSRREVVLARLLQELGEKRVRWDVDSRQ